MSPADLPSNCPEEKLPQHTNLFISLIDSVFEVMENTRLLSLYAYLDPRCRTLGYQSITHSNKPILSYYNFLYTINPYIFDL
jgi:hypothetical protein